MNSVQCAEWFWSILVLPLHFCGIHLWKVPLHICSCTWHVFDASLKAVSLKEGNSFCSKGTLGSFLSDMLCDYAEIVFVQTSDNCIFVQSKATRNYLVFFQFLWPFGHFYYFYFESGVTEQVNEYLPNILRKVFLHLEKRQRLPANMKKYYIKARLAKYWKVTNCILCLFLLF